MARKQSERLREIARQRAKKWYRAHTEWAKANMKAWREKNKDKVNAKNREWRAKHKKERFAHGQVMIAKRAHKLIPKVCCVCAEKKTVAHHEDYSKPLEVVWLCQHHHNLLHVRRRKK